MVLQVKFRQNYADWQAYHAALQCNNGFRCASEHGASFRIELSKGIRIKQLD